MEVNFIVTCFDKTDYRPYLDKIIATYETIVPHVAFCYNGGDAAYGNNHCDFVCDNKGHQLGEYDLICGGYDVLKCNQVHNWIKIGVDSWLCEEDHIIKIFEAMELSHSVYAGNYWNAHHMLSTDIMFVRDHDYKVFDAFKETGRDFFVSENHLMEMLMHHVVGNKPHMIIQDREPVAMESTRFQVPALGWTMCHELQQNIDFIKRYKDKYLDEQGLPSNI